MKDFTPAEGVPADAAESGLLCANCGFYGVEVTVVENYIVETQARGRVGRMVDCKERFRAKPAFFLGGLFSNRISVDISRSTGL